MEVTVNTTGTFYPVGDPIPGSTWVPWNPPQTTQHYHYHTCWHDTAAMVMLLDRIQKLEERIETLEKEMR